MWGPSVKNEGPSEKIAFSNFIEPEFKNLIWNQVVQEILENSTPLSQADQIKYIFYDFPVLKVDI